MTALVVVQARTGSSRFPRKVLTDIGGRPMLGFMLDRIAPLADDPDNSLVVATTDRAADDEVATIAESRRFAVVRGAEHDVLGRFDLALAHHPADTVVRLTADCPLMDPDVVRSVLEHHRTSGADYTSNTLARTFPDGLDVEVMSAEALRWAHEHAEAPDEREHVTPHLQRHPRRFQLAQLLDDALAADERWTVDRPEDLDLIRVAVDAADDPVTIRWRDLLGLLGRNRSTGRPTVTPLARPPHRRGEPYHREWAVEDSIGRAGIAHVEVDEGGASRLTVDGDRPDVVAAAIRKVLDGDLQVTQLTMTGAE